MYINFIRSVPAIFFWVSPYLCKQFLALFLLYRDLLYVLYYDIYFISRMF